MCINKDILAKLKALPPDSRDEVINGLAKMLTDRPKGLSKELMKEKFQA